MIVNTDSSCNGTRDPDMAAALFQTSSWPQWQHGHPDQYVPSSSMTLGHQHGLWWLTRRQVFTQFWWMLLPRQCLGPWPCSSQGLNLCPWLRLPQTSLLRVYLHIYTELFQDWISITRDLLLNFLRLGNNRSPNTYLTKEVPSYPHQGTLLMTYVQIPWSHHKDRTWITKTIFLLQKCRHDYSNIWWKRFQV